MTVSVAESAPIVELEEVFSASPDVVFDAWVTAGTLEKWLCGGEKRVSKVEIDARVGGKYLIVMTGDGQMWDHKGEYLEVDRPNRLAFTWHTPSTDYERSLVTITFEPEGAKTRLRLVHEQLASENVEPHRKGWAELLEKLMRAL